MSTGSSSTEMGRFVGVVPSAGTSSRMGEPKGLLELAGETFLSRTVGALAGGGCDPVFVVVAVREKELVCGHPHALDTEQRHGLGQNPPSGRKTLQVSRFTGSGGNGFNPDGVARTEQFATY